MQDLATAEIAVGEGNTAEKVENMFDQFEELVTLLPESETWVFGQPLHIQEK